MLRTIPARGDLVLVRFRGDADPIAAAVKHIARDLDPQMLVLSSTLRAQMDYSAEQGWVIGKMLLFVAGVAGFLALLGIYGAVGVFGDQEDPRVRNSRGSRRQPA